MLSQPQLLDIGLAPDLASLQQRLVVGAEELGFGLVAAVLVRGDMRTGHFWGKSIGNTPAAYVEAQRSLDDALRDPVMTALRSGVQPVLYDQATYVDAGVADLWDLQVQFGYRCGVACSMHESSHLETFMLGVDRPDALPKDAVGRVRLTAAVQMLTVHAQAAMQRICTPAPSGSPVLEGEELEVLRWAKDAYTVSQIGDKLLISNVQVRHHQLAAARKLGVSSVPAAVLRCIQGGLID